MISNVVDIDFAIPALISWLPILSNFVDLPSQMYGDKP